MSARGALDRWPVADTLDLRAILLGLASSQRALNDTLEHLFSAQQVHVLDWLIVSELAAGASSLTALSRQLGRDPGSLSRAIHQLVRRNVIHAERRHDDRRRRRLVLTRTGHVLHQRLAQRVRELLDHVADPLRMWGLDRLDACLGGVARATTDSTAATHPLPPWTT